MPIVTPRLLLRSAEISDAQAVLEYKKDSWNDFLQWMVWTDPPSIETRTLQDEEEFCQRLQDRFKKRESLHYLAFTRDTQLLVGNGTLGRCNWAIPMFTLGFAVRTGHTGHGYATEIAAALTRYAFDVLKAKKVAAFHAQGHVASQNVIEKVGFSKEGVLRRQHLLSDGQLVDEHHYGIFSVSEVMPLRPVG